MAELKQQHFDSGEYWIKRHEEFDRSHQATGLLGSSERSNTVLYDLRRQALMEAIGSVDLSGRRVLDAGCGLGDFSRFYKERGALVSGCDISDLAAEKCQQAGLGTFRAGRLKDIPTLFPGQTFDIVHCFDVLYHIVDDEEWRETLDAFEQVSGPETVWYIIELARAKGSSVHVKVRGTRTYGQELAKRGRFIARDRRIHWLLSVFPRLHALNPRLSYAFERLTKWSPTAKAPRGALWTIKRGQA
ncbi:MAG: class I SAM-dependent methyltransferase [Armatimonadetes bacterium]|nr:class I SAM-dependent methyltransferase [Armatimonadota bacterium]